jgi:hypothetical protein
MEAVKILYENNQQNALGNNQILTIKRRKEK